MSAYKITPSEKIFTGIPASPGIAIGPARPFGKESISVEERTLSPDEISGEIQKFQEALQKTKEEILSIRKHVQNNIGEENAKVFDAHLLILEDKIVLDETIRRIKDERKNADWLYFQIMRGFHDLMISGNDDYLRERGLDILDVKRRVIRNYQGETKKVRPDLPEPGIIVSHQLTPSEIVLLNRSRILGLAIDMGGKTSHVAILARSFEKPAVVGLHHFSSEVNNEDVLIVDGNTGRVILNPEPETLKDYQKRQENYQKYLEDLLPLREQSPITLDGHEIELSANIEFPEEVDSVLLHGARGVGLYRTEYLFLREAKFPDEEEQFTEYSNVATRLFPQPVIFRTFDLGGDRLSIAELTNKEDNPFLGWRSIRICLDKPDIFKTQLRAILRTSIKGNVRLMFPMITSIEEIRQAKKYLEEAKKELRQKKQPFDENLPIGIMIEVPAAAMMAEEYAREVDFMSIGTNDLIQYTLAVDRGNEKIAALYTGFHPAVLRLIYKTIEGGHRQKKWVGMCGELASHPLAIPILLGMGLDELSVPPYFLDKTKKIVRSLRYREMKKMAQKVLTYDSAEKIQAYAERFLKRRLPKDSLGVQK
ncbi:MAG: phosphoenolpyruvate--protein phosphotransferase [Calditrichaeota bacterium]|nr:phosphoenolpyruvate--protein phosphotransferase [Calditrichota bacterium]